MRKPLTNIPQNKKRTPRNEETRKTYASSPTRQEPVKSSLHNWWRIRSIRISSRNNGRVKKQQDRFCIKLYIIFYEIRFVILFCGSRTVRRTKTLFFNISEILQISVAKFKIQSTIFFNTRNCHNISVTISKFKITDVILMCLEILIT